MKLKHLLFPLLLASFSLVTAAHAQTAKCGPRDALIAELTQKFGEVSHGAGIANNYQLIEVWSGVDGSWTILSSNVNGVSCIIASGANWTANPEFASAFDPET